LLVEAPDQQDLRAAGAQSDHSPLRFKNPTSPAVDPSLADASPPSTTGCSAVASSLPSSTPHWS